MGLMNLPPELLDMILAYLVPENWNASLIPDHWNPSFVPARRTGYRSEYPTRPKCLELRLVCLKWLLTTKLNAVRGIEPGFASAIWNSVSLIGSWRICNSEAAQEEYLNVACDMLIVNKGKDWVCGKLQTLLGGSAHSSPATNYSDDGPEGQWPESQQGRQPLVRSHSLQLAAYNGDRVIVETLLKDGVDPNLSLEYFGSALYGAAYKGHADIAHLLIEHGAGIIYQGYLGSPPEAAAYQGHVETLRLLLDRWTDVDPCTLSRCLFYASEQGHTQTVQLLLARGHVDINAQFEPEYYHGRHRAGHWGRAVTSSDLDSHYGPMVGGRMLKFEARESDFSRQNLPWYYNKGETPLTAATFRGHEEIVRLLVRRHDVNLRFGEFSYCPLWRAVAKGHEGILRLFLERYDISLDKLNARDEQLFWWASLIGRANVVSLLLQRDDVNPSRPSSFDRTPLFAAAERGNDEVVRIILTRRDINPNLGSTLCREYTPLGAAVEGGHETVVASLLERQDTDPNCFHKEEAPLYLAAANGNRGIVRLLLGRSDIDLNILGEKDGSSTPLWGAAEKGHDSIVELLLSQDGINPSKVFRYYNETPFQIAAARGYDNIVQQFLVRDNIDPNENNIHGTPLWQAVRYDRESVMRLLLERADVDPNIPSEEHDGMLLAPFKEFSGYPGITYSFPRTEARIGKETPLSMACRRGKESSVRLLLEKHRINPNIVDAFGRSSLWSAAFKGHAGIVQLLLNHPQTYPNLYDSQGWTPLLASTNQGYSTVVDLLLKHVDTNPNIPNEAGWTPLLLAANEGNENIVQRLLQHPNIKTDLALGNGETALILSQKNRHHGVQCELRQR
ncbi:ankyrin repeat-containing domain protein [Xylaria curta]|nr:ankyrin repeat-containing domain protein [Xylaria curta]